MRILETDLLIIGGGAAGAKAAIEAHDLGLRVLMLVKGFLGKSGCSIFAGNLNFFAPPTDGSAPPSEEERVRRTMHFLAKYTHYLGDQEYMKNASLYTLEEFYPWLEERGVYVLRYPDGTVVTDLPRRTQAWAPQMGTSGQVIADMLRKMVLQREIPVLEETAATALLSRNGSIVGATALDYRNGEFLACRSKATILATGHSNYLSLRSTGTREGSASGWAMAYRAGAELQNIEMQWFHASDIAWPRSWMRLHMYPNPLPATTHRTQLFNRDKDFFFDGNMHLENPVPYIMQLKYLVRQVREGKARFDGEYYTSFRHVEPEVLEKYIYQTQFLKKLGLDPTKDLIENGITWHMNVGGVRVNGQTMESGIPGLYIAGSLGALVTGGLPNVMFDGTTAARHAAQWLPSASLSELDETQLEREQQRVYHYFRTEPRDGLLPAQIKKQIRTVMWQCMGYIKSERSMQEALTRLETIRRESLPKMRLDSVTRQFNYSWQETLEVEDMLDSCELNIRFSLHRQESRGAFFREDFPVTDNEHWLHHTVGRQDNGELRLRTLPVALPYAVPAELKVDFFEADY